MVFVFVPRKFADEKPEVTPPPNPTRPVVDLILLKPKEAAQMTVSP